MVRAGPEFRRSIYFNLERIRDAKQFWNFVDNPAGLLRNICHALHFGRVPRDHFRAHLGAVGRRTTPAKLADSLIPNLRTGKFNEALQATQARATAAERIFHTLILGAQTMDRNHLLRARRRAPLPGRT